MAYLDGTVDEITARRALAGADADMLEAGLTPVQADAMTVALRYYLLNEHEEARRVLDKVFMNGTVDRILQEFSRGATAAQARAA
jgi:hypothetical protein